MLSDELREQVGDGTVQLFSLTCVFSFPLCHLPPLLLFLPACMRSPLARQELGYRCALCHVGGAQCKLHPRGSHLSPSREIGAQVGMVWGGGARLPFKMSRCLCLSQQRGEAWHKDGFHPVSGQGRCPGESTGGDPDRGIVGRAWERWETNFQSTGFGVRGGVLGCQVCTGSVGAQAEPCDIRPPGHRGAGRGAETSLRARRGVSGSSR